jgi:hypothetical protein
MARTEITTTTTRYISPTGNDTNDGLTALTPWRTRQYAWNKCQRDFDLRGGQVVLQLNPGSAFTDEVAFAGLFVGQTSADDVVFQGNISDKWSTSVSTVNNSFFGFERAAFKVQYLKLDSVNGAGICSMTYSKINYNDIVFGNAGAAYVLASKNGQTVGGIAGAQYIALGSAPNVLSASAGGCNILISGTMQFWGTPQFLSGFAYAFESGNVTSHGMTWDQTTYGHAVGPKYQIDGFGTIYGSNNPSGDLPGTSAGFINGGRGQYI